MSEFKQGDEVEISDNGISWFKHKFLGITSRGEYAIESPSGYVYKYTYCRKPKQSVEEWTNEWYSQHINKLVLMPDFCIKYYNDRKRWEEENK
jgi:hypothetical protein